MSWRMRALGVLALAMMAWACGDEDGKIPDDTVSPAAITDLVVGGATSTSLTLLWTATGDDDTVGTATLYDIRYSTSPLTEENFNRATKAQSIGRPEPAGKPDYYTVNGLASSTRYYFAVKAGDAVPNWSPISNVVTDTTAPPPDRIPPSAITDLSVGNIGPFAVTLKFTAPGDDGMIGTASKYDARYSIGLITESNFGAAAEVLDEPSPQPAGSPDSIVVTGLAEDRVYYFCVRTADRARNYSGLSNIVSARTIIAEKIPPAAVTDLAIDEVSYGSVRLNWTATGDDGNVGTAYQYDVRYSISLITEGNFYRAYLVAGEPVPQPAGGRETMTVRNLKGDTKYYFAMRVADEVFNWSPISNVDSVRTLVPPDTIPPGRVIFVDAIDSTRSTVTIRWLAPGDDGNAGQAETYDIRYSNAYITESNWAGALAVPNPPKPSAAGVVEFLTITGLKPNTRYYFALKAADEIPNWSELSGVATARTTN